ncbi:hypothetical protein MPLA_140007 [Mesorhizobium sp. ORS 3359]|nr:hypothetical protein MPLA_140007 [Mesorhizobium sp. ORS 3359]
MDGGAVGADALMIVSVVDWQDIRLTVFDNNEQIRRLPCCQLWMPCSCGRCVRGAASFSGQQCQGSGAMHAPSQNLP